MYPTGYEGSKIQNVVSFGRHPRRPGGIDSGKTSRFSDEVCNRISPQPTAHSPTPTPTVSLAANSCRRPPLHLSLAADVRRARTHVCCPVECRVSMSLRVLVTENVLLLRSRAPFFCFQVSAAHVRWSRDWRSSLPGETTHTHGRLFVSLLHPTRGRERREWGENAEQAALHT